MDSTLMHINKGNALGTQGNVSKGPKNNILDYSLLTLHVPTPSSHPTDSVETVKALFLWSFNIVLGREGGGDMDL